MATTQNGVWGIDLGQCALKAIRLEEIDGVLTATHFDYVEHPKILSQPDADPDELTREALTKFLERNTLRGDIVCISVPGQSGLARFVKLPPVEEKKIADIVKFEAKQQIPFNLDEVVWDYQRIGSGMVTDGFAIDIEVGLFAMKRDMIGRYMQHFKDVNVDVQVIQMAPLALCNYVAYDLLGKGARVDGEDEGLRANCIVALDIGADSSNLVITDGDRVIWQRPIPLGGNHFTRALTKEMKLTFAKAEHLKRNATKSPDLKKILAALKPVLNDFVGEVQRSLGYFTNTHRNAMIDYMIGLGNAFRLPGLQKYLGEKLQLEVRKVGKMERLTGDAVVTQPTYTENILTYGVAYGLALQGLRQARILTNLLPGEIRTERLVKAKKPWAVAAAAVLLLGIGTMSVNAYWAETRPWGGDKDDTNNAVNKAVADEQGIAKVIGEWEGKYTQAKTNANKEAEAVRSIMAGQDEQVDWILLTKFLSEVVPLPDGLNLPTDQARKDYWDYLPNDKDYHPNVKLALTGKDAWEHYKKQLAAGSKMSGVGDDPKEKLGANDPLGRGIDDRIQFNIEMVNTRFCGDLSKYWENLPKDRRTNYARPTEQVKKAPEGRGWIIEVHGYTYHWKGEAFVLDTLVENIARQGEPDFFKPAGPAVVVVPPGTPAPATVPPVTAPAAPGVAPVAPGATPSPPPPPPPDPVHNKVSYVVLYNVDSTRNYDPQVFTLIKRSVVAELVKGPGAPAGGGGGGGGAGGPSVGAGGAGGAAGTGAGSSTGAGGGSGSESPRDSWVPLGTIGGGSASPAGGAGPGGSGGGGKMPSAGGGGSGGAGANIGSGPPGSGGPRPGAGGSDTQPAAKSNIQHNRTEFIILFVWQEPTPSDRLRGFEEGVTK